VLAILKKVIQEYHHLFVFSTHIWADVEAIADEVVYFLHEEKNLPVRASLS